MAGATRSLVARATIPSWAATRKTSSTAAQATTACKAHAATTCSSAATATIFLKAGAGRDTLTGGLGTDQFIFAPLWGPDTITDFEQGSERLDMSRTGLSFADLTIVQAATGAEISDPTGGSRILLVGIDQADISETDFIF